MRFFHLNHPNYEDDFEFEKQNPFEIVNEFNTPGITCDVCGEIWFNVSSRLPVDLPADSSLWETINKPNLKLPDHNALRIQFEKETRTKIEPSVFPGAQFGHLTFRVNKPVNSTFLWSWGPGTFFMTEDIVAVLTEAGITGCVFFPIDIVDTKINPPELFELIVTGKAGFSAKQSNLSVVNRCQACGRVEYSKITNGIHIDRTNWDGTDVCKITEYPTYILVSEKVKAVLEASNFKNYTLIPAETITYK